MYSMHVLFKEFLFFHSFCSSLFVFQLSVHTDSGCGDCQVEGRQGWTGEGGWKLTKMCGYLYGWPHISKWVLLPPLSSAALNTTKPQKLHTNCTQKPQKLTSGKITKISQNFYKFWCVCRPARLHPRQAGRNGKLHSHCTKYKQWFML